MPDEMLWPTRNVAEYAYCPRLFYYMEVEGTFLPSADTEEGNHVHRRVDRPSKATTIDDEDTGDESRPKIVRSLALTSDTLGLTATLDLAEINGTVAIPVEYRKGRPKRQVMAPPPDDPGEADQPPLSHPEPWPTDRVQVGLQTILLEEAHYTVPNAILYYASEKLRLTIPVDDALRSEALATLEAAKQCAAGTRPMPLINDSRCVRCSLQPICLPDEVNQQRLEEIKPRQIWPPRDEGIHLVTQKEGVKIGVRGASIRVTDKDGILVKDVPLANVETLALLGSVQISTQAVQVLADKSIPVAFLSAAGRLIAIIDPLDSVSADVRRAQVRRFDDPQAALALARAVIAAKIVNQRTLLQRNHTSLPETVPADLAAEADKASQAESIDVVRGHEGQAAAIYFEHFAGMFKGHEGLEFDKNGRQRRPPPDPINSCISMAYTMLTHECVAALRQARLEPSIGAFHVSRPGRPALALDLMEPFRPLIGDSVAVAAFNRGELTEGHFLRTASGCMFTDAGRRAFFSAWGRRMETEITHPIFKYRLSYRRMLVLHARMIAAWLLGEVPSLAFLTTR
jgi:CRISPR-associated protein Cas1